MKKQSENIVKFELLKERYTKAYRTLYNKEIKLIHYVQGYVSLIQDLTDTKVRLSKFEEMTNTLESRIIDNEKKIVIDKNYDVIEKAKYELSIKNYSGKNRYFIIDSITGVALLEIFEPFNIDPKAKVNEYANFFIDALHYHYLTGKTPADLLLELKKETSVKKREAALLWFRELPLNPLYGNTPQHYFELFKRTNFTIATTPSELTGREIEKIYDSFLNVVTELDSKVHK